MKNMVLLALIFICVVLVIADMTINVSDWYENRQAAIPPAATLIQPTQSPIPSTTPGVVTPTDVPSRPTVEPTITHAVEDEA